MRIISLFLIPLLLCHCGAPQPPVCHTLPFSSRQDTPSTLQIARENWKTLSNPNRKTEWPAAQAAYNESVRILFDKIRCGNGALSEKATTIGTALSTADETNKNISEIDALFPASSVKIRSKERHQSVEGLGVPTVGWRATSPVGSPRKAFHPPNGQPYNLTVVLDFSTAVPQWHFSKRWIKNTYRVGRVNHTLAADWTAPIDFFWYMCDLDNLRIQNVLLPERFTQETGVFFMEPYDPEKIPVVMVHGLYSSPDAYREILNDLSPLPWFRKNYQIWLYNYPTGTPWIYNAMLFRQNMGEAGNFARSKGPDENLKKMVILSHSMGGLLTRTAISEPGQHLYDAHFKRPFSSMKIKPATRKLISEGLLYPPLTDPKRVVFMAVPHQGSPAANFRGTGLLSNLIRLPKTLTVGLLDATLQAAQDVASGDIESAEVRPPTSISTLSPRYAGFQALKKMPLPDHMKFHSIIGDKGAGDTPKSSDGVVPYWSSHVEPVESELIVPSSHSVPENMETSEEVKRILLLHLREENRLPPRGKLQNSR